MEEQINVVVLGRAANNCTSHLDAISHKGEINLITRRVTPDFSSDLSMQRPMRNERYPFYLSRYKGVKMSSFTVAGTL